MNLALVVAPLLALACRGATTVPEEASPGTPPAIDSTAEPRASQPEVHWSDAAPILVGAWASDGGSTHERWIGVGEHLVGVGFVSRNSREGRDSREGRTTSASFEVMLLHRTDGRATFTAIPQGAAMVDFDASLEADRLVLANPEHDDPTQIVYRREGDRLAITLDGAAGPRSLELRTVEPTPAPELEALDVAFAADSAARGGAAWAERFEAQGVTWSRGSPRQEGPEAIGAGIDAMRAGGRELSWEPTASGMAPAGDMGFTTGRYRVRTREGGEVVGTGTYVTVWRRRGEGAGWRIAFDGGVSDSSPAPSEARE